MKVRSLLSEEIGKELSNKPLFDITVFSMFHLLDYMNTLVGNIKDCRTRESLMQMHVITKRVCMPDDKRL